MHVLLVPSWYPTTEAPLNGIYFAEQAHCLQEHGMKVGVVYPEQQSLRRLSGDALARKRFQTEWTDDDGVPTLRRYGWNVWWRFPPGMRLRVRAATRLANQYVDRHGPPDVIHALSARWAGAAAARISKQFDVPYVLTEHYSGFLRDAVFPWRWRLIERGFRYAQGVAAVSPSLGDTLVEQGLCPAEDVEIIPNPVRSAFFTLPPSGRRSASPFRFVTVARLRREKNVSGLLEAFADAFRDSRAIALTIVGDGPERAALEDKAHDLGIDGQVSFQGNVDREGVRSALWNANAFVLASRHETFGVVLLEALATGLPVIATRSGGPEDIVSEETGILVRPDDEQALADALTSLHDEASTYDAERLRDVTLEQFGPEPFVRRTRSFYRRAQAA